MVRGQLRSSDMPLAICLQSCVGIGAMPAGGCFRSPGPLAGEGKGCALPERSILRLTFAGSSFPRQDHESFGGARYGIPVQRLNTRRRGCRRST
jgi:hypothetical protein